MFLLGGFDSVVNNDVIDYTRSFKNGFFSHRNEREFAIYLNWFDGLAVCTYIGYLVNSCDIASWYWTFDYTLLNVKGNFSGNAIYIELCKDRGDRLLIYRYVYVLYSR